MRTCTSCEENGSANNRWELDHFPIPKALGCSDDMFNIRALHWRGNAVHGGLLGLGLAALSKDDKPQPFRGLFGLYPKS